jgi:hypothetical protein
MKHCNNQTLFAGFVNENAARPFKAIAGIARRRSKMTTSSAQFTQRLDVEKPQTVGDAHTTRRYVRRRDTQTAHTDRFRVVEKYRSDDREGNGYAGM